MWACHDTLKFGTNATFRNRFTSGSLLTVSPTALISLMIRFATKYPGAALPPKMKVRGGRNCSSEAAWAGENIFAGSMAWKRSSTAARSKVMGRWLATMNCEPS